MASSPEQTIQVAVGGHRASHSYIELVVRGATAKISPILRKAADMSGGFIASCRNPVRASYVRKNAALGGISKAGELGSTHEAFAQVAQAHGVSPQQVALAWELSLADVVIPIPGASRPASIQDSVLAADLRLTDDELARLTAN